MRIFTAIFVMLSFMCGANDALAQSRNDSQQRQEATIQEANNNNLHRADDDEFNLFLFAFAGAFISVVLGGTIIGAFAAALLLLVIFGMISFGILSVSVIAGLYTRSFKAAFRTFLIIVCTIGGVVFGVAGFWLIMKIFELDISNSTTIIAGAVGGGFGGMLLALSIFNLILTTTKYLARRLS